MGKYGLHVVGAGPAGSFAACAAAKKGERVLVSEEHSAVGEPVHCSGLVSASGMAQMSHVVPLGKVARLPIRRANLHGEHGQVSLSFPSPKAYVIDRGEFDRIASRAAQDEGAEFEFGKRISSPSHFKSSNIVGADGPDSSVARIFNFPRIRSFACAWQGDFKYSCPDMSAVEVFFNPSFAPGFIGWIIPTSEENAKIGLGVSLPRSIRAAKAKFLSSIGVSGSVPSNEFSALIPLNVRAKTAGVFWGRNVCLAGDAAGHVKASSGGGIFFGAMCGQLAGENFANPAVYESAWRKKYGADLLFHRMLRKWLDALTPPMLDGWLATLRHLRLDFVLSEVGEMDEYSKMLAVKSAGAFARAWLSR